MLRNYLKTAWRAMRRHKAYALINVLGLALGFTAGFMILLWVQDEMRYDRYHDGVEDVYRVMRTATYGEGQVFTWPAVTAKLDGILDEDYPEIDYAAMISWEQDFAFRYGDLTFREEGRHVGPDFFKILPYRFLAGDPNTALDSPEALVMTASMARKYFPDAFASAETEAAEVAAAQAVLGRVLRFENRMDVTVTGVMEDVPKQSSYRFDYLLAVEEFARRNSWIDDWGNNGLRMLVRLAPGASGAAVSDKIRTLVEQNTESDPGSVVLFLQPFTDVYLRSEFENGVLTGGRIEYVRIFTIVGFFILIIAAINFMNLATARSALRAREVGVRKTFGSSRGQLALQFLGEAVMTALAAVVLAVAVVYLLLPWFNTLTDKAIVLDLFDPLVLLTVIGLAVGTGLLAGLYPALYLSGFSPIAVLRGRTTGGAATGGILRRVLVVCQFALSVILLVGTLTVYQQVEYIRTKNLGLDRQEVFYTTLDGEMVNDYETFRGRLRTAPSIAGATSGGNPLFVGSSTSGGVSWEGKAEDDNTLYHILRVNHDFTETMKMELLAGRTFSRSFSTDTSHILINETAARAMGLDDPIGKSVRVWGRDGQIIGLVKDFHMTSLYDTIEPLVLRLDPADTWLAFVRAAPGQTEAALVAFEQAFKDVYPDYPFEVEFMDAEYEETYKSEMVMGTLANYFALFAIFVACLGLFGLASFTVERRTKEIGIRKVLGASVGSVVLLLTREFVVLVGLAFAVGAPVAYLLMQDWLQGFAYHTELGAGVFIGTAIAVLVIAYATVGLQSTRAALSNPAHSLRSE